TKIFPAHTVVQRECWRHAKIVLHKEAQPVVERVALGITGIGGGKGVADVVVCERDCSRTCALYGISRLSRTQGQATRARAEREEAPLKIVVEAVDGGTAVFAAELDGMTSLQPGEIIEDLETLAGAPAGDAERTGSEVLEGPAKVDFRQSEFARAQIEWNGRGAKAGRVGGIQGTEG